MDHNVCSNCGAPRYRGARFCNICGLAFPAEEQTPPAKPVMVCPNGCAVDDPDAAFCELCGARLVPAAPPAPPVPEAPPVRPITEIPSPFRYIPLARASAEAEAPAFGDETILTRPAPVPEADAPAAKEEQEPAEEASEETPEEASGATPGQEAPETAPEKAPEKAPAPAPRVPRPAVSMRALTDDDMKK